MASCSAASSGPVRSWDGSTTSKSLPVPWPSSWDLGQVRNTTSLHVQVVRTYLENLHLKSRSVSYTYCFNFTTGHLWVTCYEMKDTSWLLAICIFHALLYAATLVACLCTDSHKVICIWALWNGLFLLYYWIHYFVVTQNDTEFQVF